MSEPFCATYPTEDPAAIAMALRHYLFWGRTHTSVSFPDPDRVVLEFRPSPDPRWRAWERIRKSWIVRELQKEDS